VKRQRNARPCQRGRPPRTVPPDAAAPGRRYSVAPGPVAHRDHGPTSPSWRARIVAPAQEPGHRATPMATRVLGGPLEPRTSHRPGVEGAAGAPDPKAAVQQRKLFERAPGDSLQVDVKFVRVLDAGRASVTAAEKTRRRPLRRRLYRTRLTRVMLVRSHTWMLLQALARSRGRRSDDRDARRCA